MVGLEGEDGAFSCGLQGRVETEENADYEGGEESDADDFGGNEGSEGGDERDEEGEGVAQGEAHDAADETENEGF